MTLNASREDALLFRTLATLRTDEDVEALRWKGPTPRIDAMAAQLEGRGNPAVAAKNLQPQAPE